MKVTIPFVGKAYKLNSKNIDVQNCINWYLLYDETGKSPVSLMPFPGLTLFSNGSSQKSVRALFELNKILYSIIDDGFYKVTTTGEKNLLGTLKTSKGLVKIIANEYQLFLTDGHFAYVYQYSDNLTYKTGDFTTITKSSSSIDTATFTGTGLNDLVSGGSFTGTESINYEVMIDDATSSPNTFKWSIDGGLTFIATGVAISGTAQTLNNGVTIQFTNLIGHSLGDKWDFTASIDSFFYVPVFPTYQDGYGIFPRQNSNVWSITGINDFLSNNALDIAIASAYPDNIVASISIREELWLLKEAHTEVWYDTGNADFPFERRQNLLINYGCLSAFSLAVADNSILIWLAKNNDGDRIIVSTNGYDVQIISSEALNEELKKYSSVNDAQAFIYQWNGHIFYQITFPNEDKTWEYDLTTKNWFERQSRRTSSLPAKSEYTDGRYIANCFVNYEGKNLVGDWRTGNIYEMSANTYTENGEMTICERTTQHLSKNLDRLFLNELQIDVQSGTGLESGQGSDPQFMLQISRDGGHHFGNEMWLSGGKVGEYTKRLKWNRLGQARTFTFRLRVTDPVFRVVLQSIADIEETN